jgi:hypothetical protein
MTKGNHGETCSDAIRACFEGKDKVLSYSEIMTQVKRQGSWKDTTMWRYLMATVVNLIPARYEWKSTEKFLFLLPDSRYEIYSPSKHPQPIE